MELKKRRFAVIGVGNMAKAIIQGIVSSDINISDIILFDKNIEQYSALEQNKFKYAHSITDAVNEADCVLISVKPQNYDEVLSEICQVNGYKNKLYISIGAGISSGSVSSVLGGACVIRVLPNVPILIGQGVSVICKNDQAKDEEFYFVCSVFEAAGSITLIDESEMNRIIGVTSSSPAYVFKFINSIYKGAIEQGLSDDGLLDSICDVVIGSAMMLKGSDDTPEALISKVASKGGTTEQALLKLDEFKIEEAITEAMKACTNRADELGSKR